METSLLVKFLKYTLKFNVMHDHMLMKLFSYYMEGKQMNWFIHYYNKKGNIIYSIFH
jgi:hypothetical protein